ncbi:MAG: hypothetical protein OXU36_04160, partial [Candidatus Poribacteria bacterium]|nr:hypothetical protein [Candidatus Poribacteria bacterium]
MSKNKLTFSLTGVIFLASLLILLTAVLCFPVAAQNFSLPAHTSDGNDFLVLGRVATDSLDQAGISDVGLGLDKTERRRYNLLFGMPDLEAFFSAGGTIELLIDSDIDIDPGDGERKTAAGDLVISEIMWGLDEDGTTKQWIEIYNTTKFDIVFTSTRNPALSGIIVSPNPPRHQIRAMLRFTPFTTVTPALPENYIVSDTVSNVYLGKWTMPGSSGVATSPIGRENAPPQSNIVSAYRNINYAAV